MSLFSDSPRRPDVINQQLNIPNFSLTTVFCRDPGKTRPSGLHHSVCIFLSIWILFPSYTFANPTEPQMPKFKVTSSSKSSLLTPSKPHTLCPFIFRGAPVPFRSQTRQHSHEWFLTSPAGQNPVKTTCLYSVDSYCLKLSHSSLLPIFLLTACHPSVEHTINGSKSPICHVHISSLSRQMENRVNKYLPKIRMTLVLSPNLGFGVHKLPLLYS